jgi:hypothetical protein
MTYLRAITIKPQNFWVESWSPWNQRVEASVVGTFRILVAYGPAPRILAARLGDFEKVLSDLLEPPFNIEIVNRELIEDALDYHEGRSPRRRLSPSPNAPKKRSFPFEVDREVFVHGSDRNGNQVIVLKNTAPWDAKEAWKATAAMVGATFSKGE